MQLIMSRIINLWTASGSSLHSAIGEYGICSERGARSACGFRTWPTLDRPAVRAASLGCRPLTACESGEIKQTAKLNLACCLCKKLPCKVLGHQYLHQFTPSSEYATPASSSRGRILLFLRILAPENHISKTSLLSIRTEPPLHVQQYRQKALDRSLQQRHGQPYLVPPSDQLPKPPGVGPKPTQLNGPSGRSARHIPTPPRYSSNAR
eukprot:SAG31_NODE_4229_length_3440_cov_3.033224_5_plen_208_part_00